MECSLKINKSIDVNENLHQNIKLSNCMPRPRAQVYVHCIHKQTLSDKNSLHYHTLKTITSSNYTHTSLKVSTLA